MATHVQDTTPAAPAAGAPDDRPDRGVQLLCAWAGPAATMLAMLGMVVISGFIPAEGPSDSAEEMAAFYTDDATRIRIGMVVSMIAFSLFVPFGIAVAMQTRRTENKPIMTYVQIASVAIAALEGVMSTVIWVAAAYRPHEIDPDITRALHDLGWFAFLLDVPPFSIWLAAIGIAILRDKRRIGNFPRWLGYFNLWVAFFILPALMIPFFKDGPFAYNGLLALYLPFGIFFIWIVTMTPSLIKAINRDRDPAT